MSRPLLSYLRTCIPCNACNLVILIKKYICNHDLSKAALYH